MTDPLADLAKYSHYAGLANTPGGVPTGSSVFAYASKFTSSNKVAVAALG